MSKSTFKRGEIYSASYSQWFSPSLVGSVQLGLRRSRSIKVEDYVAKIAHFVRIHTETGRGQSQILFCKVCTQWPAFFKQAFPLNFYLFSIRPPWWIHQAEAREMKSEKDFASAQNPIKASYQQRSKNSSTLLFTTLSQLLLLLLSHLPWAKALSPFPGATAESFWQSY